MVDAGLGERRLDASLGEKERMVPGHALRNNESSLEWVKKSTPSNFRPARDSLALAGPCPLPLRTWLCPACPLALRSLARSLWESQSSSRLEAACQYRFCFLTNHCSGNARRQEQGRKSEYCRSIHRPRHAVDGRGAGMGETERLDLAGPGRMEICPRRKKVWRKDQSMLQGCMLCELRTAHASESLQGALRRQRDSETECDVAELEMLTGIHTLSSVSLQVRATTTRPHGFPAP